MASLVTNPHLVEFFSVYVLLVLRQKYCLWIDIVPNDGQYPPHQEHHQKYLLATGPMCRYAVDLQPMFKVLAGPENLPRLLNFDTPVRLFD